MKGKIFVMLVLVVAVILVFAGVASAQGLGGNAKQTGQLIH